MLIKNGFVINPASGLEAKADIRVEGGIIQEAKVYSDAMDWEMAPWLEQQLQGKRFSEEELKKQLSVFK